MDEILKVAERFYTRLYASNRMPEDIAEPTSVTCEVLLINKKEIGKALKDMKGGKAAGEDGITVDLLKEGGDIVLEKLAKLFSECIRTLKVPTAWKNADIIFVHRKGDTKELKNYRLISQLSVVYKLLTKVIVNRMSDSLHFQKPRKQAGFRKGYYTIDHK